MCPLRCGGEICRSGESSHHFNSLSAPETKNLIEVQQWWNSSLLVVGVLRWVLLDVCVVFVVPCFRDVRYSSTTQRREHNSHTPTKTIHDRIFSSSEKLG